ncbi:MAG: DUF4097 family beta strand repeat protein [Thermotogae bacterium]|nr:DUF4097 family beta strand repeat protein [Thermotogota bacterium]
MQYSGKLSIDDVKTLTLIIVSANLKVENVSRSDLYYCVTLDGENPKYKPDIKKFNGNLEIKFQKRNFNMSLINFIDRFKCLNVNEVYVEIPKKKTLDLDIKTVNGDVILRNLEINSLGFSGVSGDLRLEEASVADKANLSIVSGDIISSGLISRNITVRSVSGDVEFSNIGESIEQITISTVSGNITLGFEKNKPIDVTVNSASGKVKSNIPLRSLKKGKFTNFDPKDSPDDVAIVEVKSVSGNLCLNFGNEKTKNSRNFYVSMEDEVQRVIRMIENGVLRKEEGIEILKTIGYTEDEIRGVIK